MRVNRQAYEYCCEKHPDVMLRRKLPKDAEWQIFKEECYRCKAEWQCDLQQRISSSLAKKEKADEAPPATPMIEQQAVAEEVRSEIVERQMILASPPPPPPPPVSTTSVVDASWRRASNIVQSPKQSWLPFCGCGSGVSYNE